MNMADIGLKHVTWSRPRWARRLEGGYNAEMTYDVVSDNSIPDDYWGCV